MSGSRSSLGLTARMLAGSCVLGAVVVLAFVVMLVALREAHAATELAERAQRVDAAASELGRRVVDLETGQRGYALTGQEAFLEPWREALAALPGLQRGLLRSTVDAGRAQAARELFVEIDRYVEGWSRPSVALARRDLEAARARIASGEGRRRMDLLRARFAAFHRLERVQVAARSASADRWRRAAVATGVTGLAATALIALAFALYVSRSVVRPTKRLAAAADRISGGDLSARVTEGGVPELDRLARGFNRMAGHVQRNRLDLERQQAELKELDRLKDDFVATVSHELRTPLTSMVGFLEILREPGTGALSDDQRNFLEIVSRNADRLTRLVDDLLFVARLDADRLRLELGEVDVAALLAEAVESARANALHRGVRLELEAAHGLSGLTGDGPRLAQLLDNLVSNALKFTPEGGRVVVRGQQSGDGVRLEIEDTGIGIPADEIGHLAERFFRASSATSRQIPGTGLGLAISKAIVDAHAGTIDVRSELGAGTTFTVELPRSPAVPLAA